MNLLVIGSGAREHALAWKLAQSPRTGRVFVAPGNAGTAANPDLVNVPITDIPVLIEFAKRKKVAFTVVGPEAPLAAGIVDAFRAAGQKIFGPTRQAAQLESSKYFAKRFMFRHHIPTARYSVFSDVSGAHAYIESEGAPIVIKADGLASGKGVVVAHTLDEAHAAIDMMLGENRFGRAGARVLIEECLPGEEASFIAMVDGENVLALATSQDHKRLRDDDQGPNTGGMGAYSPAPVVTPTVHAKVMREIILPTVAGMASEGEPYTGFLYAGLMIDAAGNPKTIEFNCRLGDPETEPIMLRLKSDLVSLIEHALDQALDKIEAQWDRRSALGVVLAAAGYPEKPRTGDVVGTPPKNDDDMQIFHAATSLHDGQLVTAGGRVLCVTALGDTVRVAQRRAYEVAEKINFLGKQMRHDIGARAINSHSARSKP